MFSGGFECVFTCRLHNEEYHVVLFVYPNLNFMIRRNVFSLRLELGHKRGASMVHVILATSKVAYVTFDTKLTLTRQITLLCWLFLPFFQVFILKTRITSLFRCKLASWNNNNNNTVMSLHLVE